MDTRAVDQFRLRILSRAAKLKSFRNKWELREAILDRHIPNSAHGQAVFDLGNHLSDVFRIPGSSGRSQGNVAGGGNAWECLVEWYLNLCFWGTPVLASRRNRDQIPQTVLNALKVTIANNSTNSESDIVVFSVPHAEGLGSLSLDDIDELISSYPLETDVTVVQCKTNWNDNAQIPMLWDLIYNSMGGYRVPNVSVGVGGVSPLSFGNFSYAFVTVPTVKTSFRSGTTAVLRVVNLSGGNYWGKPSVSGVATSLNEFFGRNFARHFNGSVVAHVSKVLSDNPNLLSKFRSLDF
jgi:hypothetical protein